MRILTARFWNSWATQSYKCSKPSICITTIRTTNDEAQRTRSRSMNNLSRRSPATFWSAAGRERVESDEHRETVHRTTNAELSVHLAHQLPEIQRTPADHRASCSHPEGETVRSQREVEICAGVKWFNLKRWGFMNRRCYQRFSTRSVQAAFSFFGEQFGQAGRQ